MKRLLRDNTQAKAVLFTVLAGLIACAAIALIMSFAANFTAAETAGSVYGNEVVAVAARAGVDYHILGLALRVPVLDFDRERHIFRILALGVGRLGGLKLSVADDVGVVLLVDEGFGRRIHLEGFVPVAEHHENLHFVSLADEVGMLVEIIIFDGFWQVGVISLQGGRSGVEGRSPEHLCAERI